METLVLKNINLKKKVTKILDPLEFDIEMRCNEEIKEGVVFTIVYNVNVKTDKDDQILSEIEIAPIPKGNVKFSLDADTPDLSKIPHDQIFGLTSIIIIGKYRDQQFMRIGYIVDIYYPGIPNEELAYNEVDENVDYEEIAEEDEEEDEEEEEEGDEDIVVDDEEEEEEKTGETKTFSEALEDKVSQDVRKSQDANAQMEEKEEEVTEGSASYIKEELDKPVSEEGSSNDGEDQESKDQESSSNDGDVFVYKGFSIHKKKIEMNIMEPPSVHSFLINWVDEEDVPSNSEEEDQDQEEEEDHQDDQDDQDEGIHEDRIKKVKTE